MDRNTDFSFMKSGFNNLVEQPKEQDKEQLLVVASIVTTFVDKAMHTADLYVNHAKRNTITREDIKLCLMYETFKFMDRKDVQSSVENWKQILEKEYLEDEEETRICNKCGEEIEAEYYSQIEWDKGKKESVCGECEEENEIEVVNDLCEDSFKKSSCNCEICIGVNIVGERWSQWIPQTPIENVLKNVIDNKL